jgi:Bacterial membrane protein YfhO
MKKINFKALLPHVIAISIFLIVALIYCKPALEGKVLQQSDVSHFKGAIQNSVDYSIRHNGHYPLWTNGLFSGMPAYQVGGIGGNVVASYIQLILTLGLPKPVYFFFLASLCFYILCMCLRLRPWVGIIGSLAFAYATYNPVIIAVGHDTKMMAMAYMPALMGGLILIFDKKYWLGFVLTALFTSLIIMANHLQIAYYTFLTIGVMAVFMLVRFIKQKDFKHIGIAAALSITAIIIGIASNAEILMSTYEYQKETIRGGGTALTDTTKKNTENKANGLDKDYVFSYSMNIAEPFVLMVPKILGGSTDKEEIQQDNSKAIEAISSLPKELQSQLPMQYYWGGMVKPGEVGTSGPPYVGAIICMLAIFSLFIKDNKHRWWILAAVILTIMMSWGSYFDGFNSLFYKYLPFYNKFRAPSMIMVIPQVLLCLAAVIMINKIVTTEDKKSLLPVLKKGAIAVGGVFAFLFILYFSFDFMSGADQEVMKQVRQMNQPQLLEYVKTFYDGLKADRQSLMLSSILRSLGFIVLAAGLIFMYIKNIFKPVVLCTGLAILVFADVAFINTKYLNSDNYQEKDVSVAEFTPSKADQQLLSDKADYRVFNMAGNVFQENNTSYLYKSIGGYHAAKLRIYQDLIERQLSKRELNLPVLNMLNTKYFIQKDRYGVTQQVQKNDSALGNCWLVKKLVFVKNADEEMKALDHFNPQDTAFVQDAFKNAVPFEPVYDSAASIKLVKNDNDVVTYEFNGANNQFAVFSEIFYKSGWKAYVNAKELPIAKVNYVLRGLALVPGKYTVEFKFEPEGYLAGHKYGGIASLLLGITVLSLLYLLFIEYKKNKA